MKLSFFQKLWLPLVLSLLCLVSLSTIDAYQSRQMRLEERQADLEHAIQLALSVVKNYADQAAAGGMTIDQAQSKAKEAVRNMRYGASGYFVILNSAGATLMNPFKSESALRQFDPKVVAINQLAIDVIKRNGKGFTHYSVGKPNVVGEFPKVAFNGIYQPWDWIISSGTYIDDVDAAFRETMYRGLGVVLVAAALLFVAVWTLNRAILRSLGGTPSYASEIATRISENDLTVTVKTAPNDQSSLLYSMKRMQEQLTNAIRTIKVSSESIASATSEIAAGNQDLSQRTEEQAASLEETAANMEDLATTISQNTENSHQASQLAAQAVLVAERGSDAVTQVVETMDGINASADKIADIVGIIESIAFQTNILALNAAVEAARAGEQGRGFAVVAAEVRSLAQRSSSASKEIKELIQSSVERVKTGVEFVQVAGATMGEVTQAIHRVTTIMSEITDASAKQSSGARQVSEAVGLMDDVTQRNAALVEQAAAAAQSLDDQVSQLVAAVSIFRIAN
jgi:methyl-accepting chemotaxis protein